MGEKTQADDALFRYYECARLNQSDNEFSVTADDPLKDSHIIDKAIYFLNKFPKEGRKIFCNRYARSTEEPMKKMIQAIYH